MEILLGLLVGGIAGIIILVFIVLPILSWKDLGLSYKEYLESFFTSH